MATTLGGTDANNSLVSLVWNPSVAQADVAAINALILSDDAAHAMASQRSYGGFVREGLLYLPNNRGVLKLLPGDVVLVDDTTTSGWPILLSANALANGPWNNA